MLVMIISVAAISWLLPISRFTSFISGVNKLEHLQDNFKALEVVNKLDSEIRKQIEVVLGNSPWTEA